MVIEIESTGMSKTVRDTTSARFSSSCRVSVTGFSRERIACGRRRCVKFHARSSYIIVAENFSVVLTRITRFAALVAPDRNA